MRQDESCLRETIAAAEQIMVLIVRPEAERLLREDRSFRHSVFFEFVVIGEEVARLSEELRLRNPEIPWSKVSAFRNRIAHGYFQLSLPIVWELCMDEVPWLRTQLLAILTTEFPENPNG
jgi:uncharacterized protein with HEPN domain